MKRLLVFLLSLSLAFSAISFVSMPTFANTDVWEKEKNDYPNNANSLKLGETMRGYVPSGDNDCYLINITTDMRFQIVFNHDKDYDKASAWALSLYQYDAYDDEWYDYYSGGAFSHYKYSTYDQMKASEGNSYSDVINAHKGEKYLLVVRTYLYGGSDQGKVQYQVSLKEVLSGWVKKNGKTYYYKNGTMLKYRQTIGGKLYYFNSKGEMYTGWLTISGKRYYFGSNGSAVKWRQTIGGKLYYFNSNCEMVKGWLTISGKRYYFGSNGAAIRYLQTIGGKRYYFNGSYQMMKGWLKIGENWFYFTSSGAAATGWHYINGEWYYFNDSGSMRTAALKQGGKTYYFYSSGACKNP